MSNFEETRGSKPIYKKWWFWLIIVIIIIAIAYSSSTNNNSDTSKTTLTSSSVSNPDNTSDTNSSNTKTSYNVGEVYEDKNIAIKYVSLDNNFREYSEYATVKDGCKVIKAEFEFENLGSSDFLATSFNFDCYADGYDCEKFISIDDATFSSNLSTGKKAKGAVYYQVPENAENITLEYETSLWTNNKVVFIVK